MKIIYMLILLSSTFESNCQIDSLSYETLKYKHQSIVYLNNLGELKMIQHNDNRWINNKTNSNGVAFKNRVSQNLINPIFEDLNKLYVNNGCDSLILINDAKIACQGLNIRDNPYISRLILFKNGTRVGKYEMFEYVEKEARPFTFDLLKRISNLANIPNKINWDLDDLTPPKINKEEVTGVTIVFQENNKKGKVGSRKEIVLNDTSIELFVNEINKGKLFSPTSINTWPNTSSVKKYLSMIIRTNRGPNIVFDIDKEHIRFEKHRWIKRTKEFNTLVKSLM